MDWVRKAMLSSLCQRGLGLAKAVVGSSRREVGGLEVVVNKEIRVAGPFPGGRPRRLGDVRGKGRLKVFFQLYIHGDFLWAAVR